MEGQRQAARRQRHEGADLWTELMQRGRSGDNRAYNQLLVEVRQWLVTWFRRRLPPAMVEDAVQETILAMHNRRHSYDCSHPLRPWVTGIARYKWVDRLRIMARERQVELDSEDSLPSHEAGVLAAYLVSSLLPSLKRGQADAIRLVKLQGLSIDEASARCGQSPSLVKINIHRGVKRLATELSERATN